MGNDVLDNYLKEIYAQQLHTTDTKTVTKAELRQIAMDMGVSEADWQKNIDNAKTAYENGVAFNKKGNYTDAITQLLKATALNPSDGHYFTALAEAYAIKAQKQSSPNDFALAIKHSEYALKVLGNDKTAMDLKSRLRSQMEGHKKVVKTKSNRKYLIVGGAILLVLISYFVLRNKMVGKQESVYEAWAQVENTYERRADLIPQLVEVVKQAAAHEKEVLTQVTAMRANTGRLNIDISQASASDVQKYLANQQQMTGALSKLIATAERYPTLKSMDNFQDLQAQIEGSENRITVERRKFNQAVSNYNKACRQFPNSLLGFETKRYFEMKPSAKETPKLNF